MHYISSVESQKGIIIIQGCSVENQKGAIALHTIYRYSVLLALNGTSLNSDNDQNALLSLN